jgi:hypothetical protein
MQLARTYVTGNHHPIAFSVGLTHAASLTLGAPVLYDKIMANTGNGYNQTTGEFVASVDGLYTIYYHALAEKEEVNILYHSFCENCYWYL